MSCKDCDEMNEGQQGIAYFRWDTANIGILGCSKHVKEVMNKLRGDDDVEKARLREVLKSVFEVDHRPFLPEKEYNRIKKELKL